MTTHPPFSLERPTGKLLTSPLNRDIPRLFIAATRQNDGKTTTCLGLFGALAARYKEVGYIKPIGQRFIDIDGHKIDEDSYLIDSIYEMGVPIQAMSPVAIDSTFTRRFLDNPDEMHPLLVDKIVRAFDRTTYKKNAVIIEGSGHAGVGAICKLSNAEVAKLLGAKAIIVSGGGIGAPVDEIALNKSLFDQVGVEVVGAILNKVVPDKMGLVANYARKGLERLGVPLLGILPAQPQLAAPNLAQIVETVKGRWLNGREKGATTRVTKVIVGAMAARGVIEHFSPGTVIITPGDRDDVLLAALAAASTTGSSPIAGFVLTRDLEPHPKIMEMIEKSEVPIVISAQESYTVAFRIHNMTVKTQPEDADKIPLIRRLINEHIDLDQIQQAFERS